MIMKIGSFSSSFIFTAMNEAIDGVLICILRYWLHCETECFAIPVLI